VYSDSDWAGDPNDQKSVGCYIIFLNGVPIVWRSRSQKVVSLSSSEAEFYACAEAVREVPFDPDHGVTYRASKGTNMS